MMGYYDFTSSLAESLVGGLDGLVGGGVDKEKKEKAEEELHRC